MAVTYVPGVREFFRNNCPVLERTGDGIPVGRCWHYLRDGRCPRHGDVSGAVAIYLQTGRLVDADELPSLRTEPMP